MGDKYHELFSSKFKVHSVQKGQVVYMSGERSDKMYIILKGKVARLTKKKKA